MELEKLYWAGQAKEPLRQGSRGMESQRTRRVNERTDLHLHVMRAAMSDFA